jgi:hypothetical protein
MDECRPGSRDFQPDEIARLDDVAGRISAALLARPAAVQAPEPGALNHLFTLGDSFAAAQGGTAHPDRMTPPLAPDTWMIGESEHGWQNDGNDWLPIGPPALTPLRGTAVTYERYRRVLTAEDVAKGLLNREAAGNHGESAGVTGLYQFRRMSGFRGDLLWTNAGRSGSCIEHIMKGASLCSMKAYSFGMYLYNRQLSMVDAARALAAGRGQPYRMAGVLLQIGRNNYGLSHRDARTGVMFDGETERARGAVRKQDVLERLRRLKADWTADVMGPRTDQAAPPAWFCFLPGETYTRDEHGLGIAEAFMAWAAEDQEVVVIGPQYQVTDNNHLDWNGQRWSGCKFGQVLDRVLHRRQAWWPLAPLQVLWRGREILVAFHVPHAPIGFAKVWRGLGYHPYFPVNRGFVALAGGARLHVAEVEAASPRVIRITLRERPDAPPTLRYAPRDPGHRGHGNLCDADDTEALARYEYDPALHIPPQANIPELVGRPYDMRNFGIPFERLAEPAA